SFDTSQDSARSPSIFRFSCEPVKVSRVEYCGATGCTMAKVVVAWQSVVGGSATTAKLSVPPRLGLSAAPLGPLIVSRQTPARTPAVTASLIARFLQNWLADTGFSRVWPDLPRARLVADPATRRQARPARRRGRAALHLCGSRARLHHSAFPASFLGSQRPLRRADDPLPTRHRLPARRHNRARPLPPRRRQHALSAARRLRRRGDQGGGPRQGRPLARLAGRGAVA